MSVGEIDESTSEFQLRATGDRFINVRKAAARIILQ